MRANTMTVFNCANCGLSLTATDDVEAVTCRNCGETTSVPDDDFDPMSETLPEMITPDSETEALD